MSPDDGSPDRARVEESLRTAQRWSATLQGRIASERAGESGTDVARHRYRADDLADVGSTLPGLVVRRHAAARGMPVGRHAASLAFQRYCHRVCGLAVVGLAHDGGVLDLRATNVVTRFEDGSPVELLLTAPRLLDPCGSPVERLVTAVFDEHLLPVARAFSATCGVGLPNLCGNIAASFAGGVRVVALHVGIERARALGEKITASRPHLSRGGSYRVLTHGGLDGLFFDRASCCHWYAAPDGRFCSWCSRVSCADRTATFESMLAERAAEAPPLESTPSAPST